MWRSWKFWLGMVVSLFFLWLAFRGLRLDEAADALRQTNYLYLLPALAAYFVGVWLRALRWSVLLAPIKRLSANRLFSTVVIGYLANNVLPARLGEVVRAYILGQREGVSKTATLGTIVVERMFDGLTMVGFLVVALTLFPAGSGPGAQLLSDIVQVGAPLFVLALLFFLAGASFPQFALRVLHAALRIMPQQIAAPVGRVGSAFLDGLAVLRDGRRVLAVFALSVALWLCEASMYYLLMLGFPFAQPVPFYVLLLATAAANLFTIVPSTPGYLGVFDYPVVATLKAFSVADSLAQSYTALLHVALWVPVSLLGAYFLWREGLSLTALQGPPKAGEPGQATEPTI